MSRSGYTDEVDDQWQLIRWRGAVASAIKGSRGQAFLREVVAALDAMPVKELASGSLVNADGEFCTLGAVGAARGMDVSTIDPEDFDAVADAFGIAPALAREIVFENDEQNDFKRWVDHEICGPLRRNESRTRLCMEIDPQAGAKRFAAMRKWAVRNIAKSTGGEA